MKLQKEISTSFKSALSHTLLSRGSIHQLEDSFKESYQTYPELSEHVSTSDASSVNFLPEAKTLQSSRYTTPNIFSLRLNDLYFCPEYNILHTKSRQILEESISTQKELEQFDAKAFYLKKRSTIAGVCSLFRSHKNGYYHTLIDNLPRLYLLHHSKFKAIEKINILLSSQPTKVEKFYLDRLFPNNANILLVDKNETYKLEDFIFPSFLSRRFSGYLPSIYIEWFVKRVAPNRPRKKANRIFISRIPTQKGRQRCILNENELFERLEPYGFKRYVLDHMNIEEQIELFYDAETVVAAHGAGLTNTIFSEKINILELFPTQFIVPHYYFLSKSLRHNYRYLCAQEKGKSSSFNVDIEAALNIVKKIY
ncbi:MAG: glycosyltransferase family 61 protein [Cyanobacteria bacterium P01_H01_bin.21]